MQDYQQEFIEFAIEKEVLRFGEFTLKSGRVSPYFFNSGLFNDGDSLARLGTYYMQAIKHAGLAFDMLFGPAYKGIPLVSAIATSFSQDGRNLPYCFNRKEEKDHGEGGMTLGAPLLGRVLIVDDVITAGTSVNLSVELIKAAGATPAAVAIALDRQERGQNELSAIQEAEQNHGLQVIGIINLDNLLEYLAQRPDAAERLAKIREYREKYGV